MKKRIILFILLVFSVVMVVTGLYMNGNIGKDKTLSLPKDAYELTDVKTIKLCIAPEGCLYTGEDMYATITYDFNNEDIQNTLKKINQETDELYQKARFHRLRLVSYRPRRGGYPLFRACQLI